MTTGNAAHNHVLVAFIGLSAISALTFALIASLQDPTPSLWQLAADPQINQALYTFAEVSVGLLGVVITVVAIVVQLAADRYTPKISELFVKDPINIGILSFYVVSTLFALWVSLTLHQRPHPTYLVICAIFLMTLGILTVLPYFAYVFNFLSPEQIILRLRWGTAHALQRGTHPSPNSQALFLTGTQQLGELALNSIEKHDKAIGLAALEAISHLALDSISFKAQYSASWFQCGEAISHDQDFVALHPNMILALERRKTWVEMKVLRQYQAVFAASVNRFRDLAHVITIHTCKIALKAHKAEDKQVFLLAIRFMNTYLRASINGRDVRTAYNLLNEYRQLITAIMPNAPSESILELVTFFKFYGQLSFNEHLPFILETIAYDLCALIEVAYQSEHPAHSDLLALFLELDTEPDGTAQERALRGVRKAQTKLATYYLVNDAVAFARQISEDMKNEPIHRLRSIKEELLSITEPEFWEVADRGLNFDWLPPKQRAQLPVFFSFFSPSEPPPHTPSDP